MPQPPAVYAEVQSIAKKVLSDLVGTISPRSSESTIAAAAATMLQERGLPDTWYYQCPALVLAGDRSCFSLSGRDYVPSEQPAGEFNLVTIDLSPCRGSVWGDCARSIYVEQGMASTAPTDPEFGAGHRALQQLHADIQAFARPETSFHDLWKFANARIQDAGYENLDFLGNVGHSIATVREDRSFIEQNNRRLLGDVPCFTFEPHLRRRGGLWGFKHEDIYYFDDRGRTTQL